MRRRTLLFLAVFATLGCRERRREGREARRVISLSPATTEAAYALGGKLVGRSRFCDYPPEARELPSVGGFVDPSLEAILGLAPDLVIGVQGPGLGPDLAERLDARGVASWFPLTDRMSQIDEMLLGLGERLGRLPAARELVGKLSGHRARVARALDGRPRPRALLVFGLRPIVAAGHGGFPHEMLTLAGAENAIGAEGTRYPTLGIERVLALDPDVIIDATGAPGHASENEAVHASRPGWKELRAVRAGRLVTIRDDRALRPGPRIAEGLEVLARALHPGLEIPE
jgi:iron complex transport system substrate-binding protein